ncbi:hypothetical protein ACR42D_10540 [Desulfovibrio caledoniensis]
MTTLRITLCCVILLCALPASAQQFKELPSHEDIMTMYRQSGDLDTLKTTSDILANSVLSQVSHIYSNKLGGEKIPDEDAAFLKERLNALFGEFFAEVMLLLEDYTQQNFTKDEIVQLNALYSDPTWQKLIKSNKKLQTESARNGQIFVSQAVKRAMEKTLIQCKVEGLPLPAKEQ